MNKVCERLLLARGNIAEVECCPHCVAFHLTIRSTTQRFDFTAVRDLSRTLNEALIAYQRATGSQAAQTVTSPQRQGDVH